MRNLLINLTFIFILVLGGASDAFSQREVGGIEILEFLQFDENFNVGGIEILGVKGGGRLASDYIPKIKVTISSKDDNIVFIEHNEDYTFTNMKITIPQEEIDKLNTGIYLLTVNIEDKLIGTREILIE